MTQYYQLSTDYSLAVNLLNKKNRLPIYLNYESGDVELYRMWLNEDLEFMIDDLVDGLELTHLERFLEKNSAQFLLPTADPAITLRDTLENAIKDRENLKHSLTAALNECDELRAEKANLNHELEIMNNLESRAASKLEKAEAELESQKLRIAQSDIKKLDREIEMLQETLESAQSLHESQVSILRSSLDELKICRSEYLGRIQTLKHNLQRSDSDRLSDLTAIMRMVQALEDTPQDKRNGAIYLIERVIYEQICRLDPSQSL